MRLPVRLILAAAAAASLAACTESRLRLSPDFGEAVNQDARAQIADPDAHYAGTPDPGAADGVRTAKAQERYQKGEVLKPQAPTTSNVGGSGSGSSSPH